MSAYNTDVNIKNIKPKQYDSVSIQKGNNLHNIFETFNIKTT